MPTVEDLHNAGPTVSLWPIAGQMIGISKSHTYKLARDDQFPAKVIKVGASYRVVTADLLRLLDASEVA
ncbi:DNA-binding protein [Gordonia sp. NPDC003429]